MYPTGYEGSTIFLRLPRLSAASHAMMGYDGQMGSLDGLNRSSTHRISSDHPQDPSNHPQDPSYLQPAEKQKQPTRRIVHLRVALHGRHANQMWSAYGQLMPRVCKECPKGRKPITEEHRRCVSQEKSSARCIGSGGTMA